VVADLEEAERSTKLAVNAKPDLVAPAPTKLLDLAM